MYLALHLHLFTRQTDVRVVIGGQSNQRRGVGGLLKSIAKILHLHFSSESDLIQLAYHTISIKLYQRSS